jgi:hypothetical protein
VNRPGSTLAAGTLRQVSTSKPSAFMWATPPQAGGAPSAGDQPPRSNRAGRIPAHLLAAAKTRAPVSRLGIRGPGRVCLSVWPVVALPWRIVDQASGSHHMSAERTKPVAATTAALVRLSDQISDRDVVRRVGTPGTSGASWARSSGEN